MPADKAMRNTTLKNIPDPVYERLRQRAARNRRSLNQEMLQILSESVGAAAAGTSLPDQLAAVRARYHGPVVDADLIRELRDEGRP